MAEAVNAVPPQPLQIHDAGRYQLCAMLRALLLPLVAHTAQPPNRSGCGHKLYEGMPQPSHILLHSGYQPRLLSCSGGGTYTPTGKPLCSFGAAAANSRGSDSTPRTKRAWQYLHVHEYVEGSRQRRV